MHCNDGAARSGITVAADLFLYVVDHNQVIESNFESCIYSAFHKINTTTFLRIKILIFFAFRNSIFLV